MNDETASYRVVGMRTITEQSQKLT